MSELFRIGEGCQKADRAGDVVFVHGLGGNGWAYWHSNPKAERGDRNFWPGWLAEELPEVGVWSLEYEAALSQWKGGTMPLTMRARNVLDAIALDDIGGRPVVFIAHSMGGLLVKQMLRHALEIDPSFAAIAQNTRGIIFLATPHSGSVLANLAKLLGVLLNRSQSVQELEASNPLLSDLGDWFANCSCLSEVQMLSYCETKPYKKVIVVDRESARLGLTGTLPIEVDEDHMSICKLPNREHQIYRRVKRFLREVLVESVLGSAPASETLQSSANPFDVGSPVTAARFYGRRAEREALKGRVGAMSPQSINLVGIRLSGKTSLLLYLRDRISEFCVPDQQPLLVFLDLQRKIYHKPEGILEGVRREVEKQTGMAPWAREENGDEFAISDGLERIRDQGYRLLVLLDEFEAISRYLQAFADWGDDWRAKVTAGMLTMVVASKRPVYEVYEQLGMTSPFANIFTTTWLGALEEVDWQRMVREKWSAVTAEQLAWMDEVAGGMSFYVQMAGEALWLARGNLEQADKGFADQARPRFLELWKGLTPEEQSALRAIGKGTEIAAEMRRELSNYGLIRADGSVFSSKFLRLAD